MAGSWRLWAISCALAVSLVQNLAAQTAPAAAPDPGVELKAVFAHLRDGEYLAGLDELKAGAHDPRFGENNPLAELWVQLHPWLSENVDPSTFPAEADAKPDAAAAARFASAETRDAIDEIVRRARDTRIVILNEAHHSPRDRAFGLEVARALRPLGYTILAVETLGNFGTPDQAAERARRIQADGYIRRADGMYLRDPAFADFMRGALALGYRPVPYEYKAIGPPPADADPLALREQGEADNLVARLGLGTSDAKILIYVGYAHAAEAPMGKDGGGDRWMAARLKAMTGIDPLTIDQTVVSEFSLNADERALYAVVKPRLGKRPVVFVDKGGPVRAGALGGAMDLQVVHPPVAQIGGRPDWLLWMGRKPVPIPANLLPRRGRRLVQAFAANEADDAVPVDQVVVEAGKEPPVLMLPDRPVRYAVQDAADTA